MFLKIFSFKIIAKCSLDARNIATLRENSANIPGILRAAWVPYNKYKAVRSRSNSIDSSNEKLIKPLKSEFKRIMNSEKYCNFSKF